MATFNLYGCRFKRNGKINVTLTPIIIFGRELVLESGNIHTTLQPTAKAVG